MSYFLKFPDEATAIEVLALYRADDAWITGSHEHALDIVGTISKVQPDESVITLDGYHINFAGRLPEAALPYEVFPATPSRVFL